MVTVVYAVAAIIVCVAVGYAICSRRQALDSVAEVVEARSIIGADVVIWHIILLARRYALLVIVVVVTTGLDGRLRRSDLYWRSPSGLG